MLLMLELLSVLLLSLIVRRRRRLFMIEMILLLLRLSFIVATPVVEPAAEFVFVASAFMVTSIPPLRLL